MPPPRNHSRRIARAALALSAAVLHGDVPTAGLLILRDGEPGEPEGRVLSFAIAKREEFGLTGAKETGGAVSPFGGD
jgi:hypothetical protein